MLPLRHLARSVSQKIVPVHHLTVRYEIAHRHFLNVAPVHPRIEDEPVSGVEDGQEGSEYIISCTLRLRRIMS